MTSPDRWQHVERLYHAALTRDEGDRATFLRDACGGDETLRREVESLLAYASDAQAFMAVPALEAAAALIQADTMATPLVGQRLGPYEIGPLLGAGGMGEVYRAKDTRLDRTVAIKILPRHFADAPARRQRFEREARAVSRLSHPHICALYDIGEENGTPFLVMEYLDGETLAHRLMRGPLPVDQVLHDAIDIADALDHAHRAGIVHRDLKPANIMLTKAGVKLLDFGVARLIATDADQSILATHAGHTLTEDGTIPGTLRYMAPEQLEGRDADARSDIFAFGAVVYEMATGEPAFHGQTPASTIAAILEREPPRLTDRQPLAPPMLDRIVAQCLAKDPDERWQTARDLARQLRWIADGATQPTIAAASAPPRASRASVWAIAAAAVIIVGALAAIAATLLSRRGSSEAGSVQFSVPPPAGASFNPSAAFLAVSPDGRSLVFAASARDGNNALWVRPINSVASRQLPGADGVQPFWSADGRFIAFSNSGTLKRIEVASGVIATIAPGLFTQAGAWNRDGTILFQRRQDQGGLLYRVAASGGQAVPVTTLDSTRKEVLHIWPQWLPDGRHFLYLARSSDPQSDGVVYVGSLDSTTRTQIIRADSHAAYSPSGHLLFIQGGSLVAHAFDARTFRLTGEPIVVAEEVELNPLSHRGAFSISETGVLAYRSLGDTEFRWYDRNGRAIGSVGGAGQYKNPVLSPDDLRLAVGRLDPEHKKGWDIWTIELARGIASRITVRENANAAVWSPDGSELGFKTGSQFARRPANGTGRSTPVFPSKTRYDALVDWSPDGRSLICQSPDPKTFFDLWTVPLSGGTSTPIVQTEFQEMQARVAPNGRWIAYVSNESGRYEVYLRPFPAGDDKWRISVDGGVEPVWRRDSGELFFLAPDRSLMAVPVGTDRELVIGRPERLFQTRMLTVVNAAMTRNQYAVTGDGRRFLIGEPSGETPPITVVLNWTAALKQ